MRQLFAMGLCAVLAFGAASARAETVVVFAAASLGTALDDIAHRFETDTGHTVTLSMAGSSVLARQVIAGAPADVFISASTQWMDAVQQQGALQPDSRVDLLGNRLVLVGASDQPDLPLTPRTDLIGALGGGRLAMALVDAVPAGQYGRQAFEALGLWPALAPHVAQTDNVRAALTLVLRHEAPLGVVYASDLTGLDGVRAVARFDPALHDPIRYPAALTIQANAAAGDFLAYLQSDTARALFAAQGFVPLP